MMLKPVAAKSTPGMNNEGGFGQSIGKAKCARVAIASNAIAIRGGLKASIFEQGSS